MILLSFILALASIKNGVFGSPTYTSSVYLQRGINSVPALEYVEYGPAALPMPSAQYTRIAGPAQLVPTQYSGLTPCVAPCVYETAVASPPPNANIVAYPAPVSKLSIEQSKSNISPYEYSYVIYDENTGDKKAQKELSDGGVVRGQYSLLQPNGYVREVQYTADDTNGFNAVVKNFLPPKSEDKVEMQEEKQPAAEKAPEHASEDIAAPNEAVKEVARPGSQATPAETALVTENALMSTDMAPMKEESKKYVLTYEDLIKCAQALFEGNPEHHPENQGHADPIPHGSYGVPVDEPGHEVHAQAGQPLPENKGSAVSSKPAKKSPLTYIILPSLGVGKPC